MGSAQILGPSFAFFRPIAGSQWNIQDVNQYLYGCQRHRGQLNTGCLLVLLSPFCFSPIETLGQEQGAGDFNKLVINLLISQSIFVSVPLGHEAVFLGVI